MNGTKRLPTVYIPHGGAPGGVEVHPREEHVIPLMVAAGAADGDAGVRTFSGSIAGKALSAFQFGGS